MTVHNGVHFGHSLQQPQFGASKKAQVLRDDKNHATGYVATYDDVVLLGGARTPFGRNGGSLAQVGADQLLETAMQGAMDKIGLEPGQIDNTLMGNIISNDAHGRFLHKKVPNDLGVPYTSIASEVNRLCGTGFELVRTAADFLVDGADGVVMTGGVENMSRTPLIDDQFLPDAMAMGGRVKALWEEPAPRLQAAHDDFKETLAGVKKFKPSALWRFPGVALTGFYAKREAAALKAKQKAIMEETLGTRKTPDRYAASPGDVLKDGLTDTHVGMVMYETADELAKRMGITRAEADEFAAESQRRAGEAQKAGRFNEEIVPVVLDHDKVVDRDEHLRPDTKAAKLATLKVLDQNSEDAIHTPGTSSGVVDGAAAIAVSTGKFAKEKHLPVLAKLKSVAVTGCDPSIMGYGPLRAAQEALKASGLTLADMDIVEVNEAFAGQVLAVAKSLAQEEGYDYDELKKKLNPDGGAIALGHPLSASGTRITLHTAMQLKETNKRYALVSACIGGGQGIAMVVENPDAEGHGVDLGKWEDQDKLSGEQPPVDDELCVIPPPPKDELKFQLPDPDAEVQ